MRETQEWNDDDIGRWYWSIRRATSPLHRHWLRRECIGRENVPPSGGAILAANHLSFIDSVLLMYATPRRASFLGKVEYLSRPTTRRLFPAAGMIPVDRSGRGVGRSLGVAQDRLDAGEIVGIFPEGTRSRDGLLGEGHVGVAHLALKTGAPIIPVGIVGSDEVLPIDSLVPRRVTVSLRFGAPIDLGPWASCRPAGKVKREITAEVMRQIAALSGQRTRDQVSSSSTTAIASSRPPSGAAISTT